MKNWCFWNVVLDKTLESSLDWKSVSPKGNKPWIFIGRTDAEADAPKLWPPDAKSRLTGKDPDAGKDGRQEEKGVTEAEMVRWHHRLNRHELSKLQEMVKNREAYHTVVHGVAELHMTEWVNNTCWKLLPKSCFIRCFPTNILEGFCIPYADFSTLHSHSKDLKTTYGELHKGTVWWFLKNLKTGLLCNQTIPLLST